MLVSASVLLSLSGCVSPHIEIKTGMTIDEVNDASLKMYGKPIGALRQEPPPHQDFIMYQTTGWMYNEGGTIRGVLRNGYSPHEMHFHFIQGQLVSEQVYRTEHLVAAIADDQERIKAANDFIAQGTALREKRTAAYTNCLSVSDVAVCPYDTNLLSQIIEDWIGPRSYGVRNNGPEAIKDLVLTCEHIAKSGALLLTETVTLYQIFEPKKEIVVGLELKRVAQTDHIDCIARSFSPVMRRAKIG